jgi:hypothetical protein
VASAALLLATISSISGLSGCGNCTRQGMSIAADTRTTTITAPPGGGSRQMLEVTGHSFNPGTPIILFFRNYPALDPARAEFQESTTTDSAGAFVWSKDIFQLPQRNFSTEAAVDIWITAKEQPNGCSAATSIKTGKVLNPPLH